MEERISTVRKLELKKDNVLSMIMFNRDLSGTDLKFLEEEFDFYKEDINNFVANYKNIGVVFKLTAVNEELVKDWKMFLQRVIKKAYDFDKFHNLFLNKKCDKVLLVSNKRLLNVDLKKLNEKIEEINFRIENYDEKVTEEMEDLAEATKDEHKGIFGRIVGVLKR